MSKTETSSFPDAASPRDSRQPNVDGDELRLDDQLAEPLPPLAPGDDQTMVRVAPPRTLDDGWALTGGMAVPEVPGVTDGADDLDDVVEPPLPSPTFDPAAPVVAAGRDRSNAARVAALRALGSKTMPGVGPAPITKGARAAAGSSSPVAAPVALPQLSPTHLQASAVDPTSFTSTAASPVDVGAQDGAPHVDEPRYDDSAYDDGAYQEPYEEVPASDSSFGAPHAEVHAASHQQAPLYLDDAPDLLKLSTGTSEVSVPAIDPGVSASMSSTGLAEPYGDEPEDERESASPAYPPAIQALSLSDLPRRSTSLEDSAPPVARRAAADWFAPGASTPEAEGPHGGHTLPQQDHSFTEPSRRRNRPSATSPNRMVTPLVVFAGASVLVFAIAYLYYRSQHSSTSGAEVPAAVAAGTPAPTGEGSRVPAPASSGTPDPGATAATGPAAAAPAAGDGLGTDGTAPPAAPASAASAAAAAAPAGGAPTPAGFVDVRFDSHPAGANVMLVDRDRGATSPVGATPVRIALDPHRRYDAVFTLEGHPTKVVSVDPKSPRVVAELSEAAAPPAASPSNKASGKGTKVRVADSAAKRKVAREATPAPAPEDADEAPTKAVDAASLGRLSISSKPPCEIAIDGKGTGLMTPQRDLPLPAGIHRITLTNKDVKISETIAVRVTAGKETKVTQDYTGAP